MTTFTSASKLPLPKPRKSLGQHFLVDIRVLDRIANAARLSPHDVLIEIGPGRGALTRRLLRQVSRVVAVELDSELAKALPARLEHPANLSVVCGDARTVDLSALLGTAGPYKVVANLPYYAANPIIRRFLERDQRPEIMVVMVQQEVAESMVAEPGRMSVLSVATQFYSRARMVCKVPPTCFRPSPKVHSAVVRLDPLSRPAVDVERAEDFFELVKAGFSAPRKQLRNSLVRGLGIDSGLASAILADAQVDGTRRAETLGLPEWGDVYRAWDNLGRSGPVRIKSL